MSAIVPGVHSDPKILGGDAHFCRHAGTDSYPPRLSGSWRPAGGVPRPLPDCLARAGSCGPGASQRGAG